MTTSRTRRRGVPINSARRGARHITIRNSHRRVRDSAVRDPPPSLIRRTMRRNAIRRSTLRNVRRNNVRNNNSVNELSEDEKQQLQFDKIMQFFLETVSSIDTLQDGMDITRKTIGGKNWDNFVKRIRSQTPRSDTPLPDDFAGIYAKIVGDRSGSVHYYGVRKESDDIFTVGNGYPSAAGIGEYSVGLDVQKDHSHGLCQTYALMYYFGDENLLKRGPIADETEMERNKRYRDNVDIGLNWLKTKFLNMSRNFGSGAKIYKVGQTEFTDDSEDDKGNKSAKEIRAYMCRLSGRHCEEDGSFNLFDMIKLITDDGLKPLLDRWFG